MEGREQLGATAEPVGEAREAGDVVTVAPRFEFYRRKRKRVLIRHDHKLNQFDRLVDGRWVPCWSSKVDPSKWTKLDKKERQEHRRRYVVSLLARRVSWSHPLARLIRGPLGRLLVPPPAGGAGRRWMKKERAEAARRDYQAMLRDTETGKVEVMEEQALLGFEHQKARISAAETRANFFLAGAGLTTTAILANASFLIGERSIHGTWRGIAVVVLLLTSIFALMSGLRALQAVMLTFRRSPPNSRRRLLDRLKETDTSGVHRSYLAALLVALARASIVGDWKVARMAEARGWFLGVIVGAVLLSVCVIFGAVL